MSQESQSYVVEAGGAIPSFVSEAESVDNQGRPINSRLEQQQFQSQLGEIINPQQQRKQEQQQSIPPPTSQNRRGITKKEGKVNKKTQSQQIEDQHFKREIKQDDQKEPQEYQRPVDNVPQKQFSQQSAHPKQQREKQDQNQQSQQNQQNEPITTKNVRKPKTKPEPQQRQQRQKSDERGNEIKQPNQPTQQSQIPPKSVPQEIKPIQQEIKPIQQEIKQPQTVEQRRVSQPRDQKSKRSQVQQNNQRPAQSQSQIPPKSVPQEIKPIQQVIKPIQQEIKQPQTVEQRRVSQPRDQKSKRSQVQQNNQRPAQSVSPDNNPKKLNILKKIKKMQGSVKLLIRKIPFMRMVRRTSQIICDENQYDTPRFTYEAIEALQQLMEATMISTFEDALTLYGKDLSVLRRIRNAPWDYI